MKLRPLSCRCFAATIALVLAIACSDAQAETIRVMTFNLWHGGDAGKQPLERSVEVIRAARAEVVGFQETHGLAPAGQARPDRGAEIAKTLGWRYFDQGGRTGIASKHPIAEATKHKWGVKIRLESGRTIFMFNAHLAHAPYQPYQLLKIPYGNGEFLETAEQAIEAANKARGEQVTRLLAEINETAGNEAIVFLTGDFNEPSHLDWTAAAAESKLCPLAVAWPSTQRVVEAGLADAYRAIHPDPIAKPGLTWTPITSADDPKDRHDRIDFVFARGPNVKAIAAEIIGENAKNADVVVERYPSDHRAVVAEFEIGES